MYFRSITTHNLPNIYLHAHVYSDTAGSDRIEKRSYTTLFDYYTASAPFLFTTFFFVVFFVEFCFWGLTRVKPRLKLLHDYLAIETHDVAKGVLPNSGDHREGQVRGTVEKCLMEK